MKYNHTPRPEIEQHYHIRDLIERQEKRTEDRNYHRERGKIAQEREDLIKDAKLVCITDFWCNKCEKDFRFMSMKEIEIDWSNPIQRIAFYRAKCAQGHWCIRLITDRHRDGFFSRSKLMAIDRGKHYNDTLQPWQTGFNLLYNNKIKR